jgi:hypothetical protein
MGVFDFFKKKEEVKLDYNVNELKKGFLVDYFLKTWEVKEVCIYDWGNNFFTREYLIDSGDEKKYLHVEKSDGDFKCSLSVKANLTSIDANIRSSIIDNDEPPKQVTMDGEIYHRTSESVAECFEEGDEESSKLVNWMFMDATESKFISVDRWGEQEIEGAVGEYVKVIEFSNILPR